MTTLNCYNQTALGRLAVVLLRQNHPATMDEGRATLKRSLGVYAPETQMIDRAVSDYFRSR
jgi:hypothetical protein